MIKLHDCTASGTESLIFDNSGLVLRTFVPNPLNRYTLSQRNKFVTNPDGSVDLYLQADSPGKAKEANWLPTPKAKFVPMMRLYWPKETPPSIIDGTWSPPPIKKAG